MHSFIHSFIQTMIGHVAVCQAGLGLGDTVVTTAQSLGFLVKKEKRGKRAE